MTKETFAKIGTWFTLITLAVTLVGIFTGTLWLAIVGIIMFAACAYTALIPNYWWPWSRFED